MHHYRKLQESIPSDETLRKYRNRMFIVYLVTFIIMIGNMIVGSIRTTECNHKHISETLFAEGFLIFTKISFIFLFKFLYRHNKREISFPIEILSSFILY